MAASYALCFPLSLCVQGVSAATINNKQPCGKRHLDATAAGKACILAVMLCPKCKNEMEAIEYAGVEVDRCKGCKGIWFDIGENFSLRNKDAAAAIDTGDPSRGRQTNDIDRYRCPRCNGGMMRASDPRRTHIWYEECTSCRGSFFDAGEFTGLTDDAISELLEEWQRTGR